MCKNVGRVNGICRDNLERHLAVVRVVMANGIEGRGSHMRADRAPGDQRQPLAAARGIASSPQRSQYLIGSLFFSYF